ncbi:MAG: tetratricopeptide repeat protein, partial [Acidobacteria bacterium]|nr:tetratricopeptide repeat protein [Acidobacteriota bacterium]
MPRGTGVPPVLANVETPGKRSCVAKLMRSFCALGLLLLAWSLEAAEKNRSVESLLEEGQRAFDLGNYQAALDFFNRAGKHSSSCQIPFYVGLAQHRLKQLDEAIISFRRATACDPKSLDAQVALGDAYAQRGDDNRALSAYESALKIQPNHLLALQSAARLYLKHELHQQSVPVLERWMRLEPHAILARSDLAAAYAAIGRMEAAEKAFQEVLKLKPDAASALLGLGNLYLKTNRPNEALPLLDQAARLAPSSYEPRFLLGSAYNHLQRFEEAVSELEQARRLATPEPEIFYQLAQAYGRLGRTEERQKALARFVELKSKANQEIESLREAARLLEQANPLVESGNLKTAIELVEKARSLDPQSDRISFRLAGLYYDTQRYQDARQCIDAAIARAPSEWHYHYLLGLIEKESRNSVQALHSFEKAAQLNPKAAEAYNQIGNLALAQNDWPRAIEKFKRAIENDPRQSAYRLNLAAAYRAAGDLERSQQEEAEFHRLSRPR